MKIYLGKDILFDDLYREYFEVVSVDQKITDQYGTLDEFVWRIMTDKVPADLKKPKGLYEISCQGYDINDSSTDNIAKTIHLMYDPQELNIRIVIGYFQKIGVEIEVQDTLWRVKERHEREALFKKSNSVEETFGIISVDKKIIEQYGTAKAFIHKMFFDYFPELRRPDGMPEGFVHGAFFSQLPSEFNKPEDIYFLEFQSSFYRHKIDDELDLVQVRYNPRKMNVQMLEEYFKKIGFEVEPEYANPGTWNAIDRQKHESLFGKTEEFSEIDSGSGPMSMSLFKIIPNECDKKRFPNEFQEFLDFDKIRDYPEEFGADGLRDLWYWGGRKAEVVAFYYEKFLSEEEVVKYCKEKFGMAVTGEV